MDNTIWTRKRKKLFRIFHLYDIGNLKSVVSAALEEILSDFSTGTEENMDSDNDTLPVCSRFASAKNVISA